MSNSLLERRPAADADSNPARHTTNPDFHVLEDMVGKYGLNLQDWGGVPVGRLFGKRGTSSKDHRMPPPDDKPSPQNGEVEDRIDEILGERRYPQLVKTQAVGELTTAATVPLELPTLPAPEHLDTAANPIYQRREKAPLIGKTLIAGYRPDLGGYGVG